MRTTVLAPLILLGSLPAAHADRDYPWCVVGDDPGWPGEFMYVTREQCLASASGRWNTTCDINPRVRFKQRTQPGTRRLQERRGYQRPDSVSGANGGRGGIRTHGTLAGTPVFKTGALNHSATLPSPESKSGTAVA